nr:hypothetical protein [Kibdelosporangium sp. MJ126-NF4]CEL16548.1 hypothetical protein [Kibdelosporangium sp. MJ126-NF4]CTQ90501.1 hypothetical protein [Kibdelosporangium sp. MJ126-NF4]
MIDRRDQGNATVEPFAPPLGQRGTAAAALAAPVATAETTGGTYEFGYESGFEAWAPKTDETAGAPDCDGPHDSAVLRSGDKPRTGAQSVDFK